MNPLPRAATARVRVLLLSVVSIGVLVFGIVGMHAGMVGTEGHIDSAHSMMATAPGAGDGLAAAPGATADVMQNGMGGMSAMDCLLLGLMCVFGAIALVLMLTLIARLRIAVRHRLVVRSLETITGLRRPEPPSLLVLSISRT